MTRRSPGRITPDWIAAEQDLHRLRVRALAADGAVLAEAVRDRGPADFGRMLLELIGPWLDEGPVTVIACGMISAGGDGSGVPFRPVPSAPLAAPVSAPAPDPRISLGIIPGLSQASPPDVLQGDETRIAGFLAAWPDFDGVLCLPGSHSRWVRISAGEVVSFATAMTGEMFDLLARESILRHGLAGGSDEDEDAFREAVDETLSRPERLATRIFGIHAEELVAGLSPASARARLSGLLIGAELAAARPYWLGQEVVLISEPKFAGRYRAALALQGLDPVIADADAATLAGLARARVLFAEAGPRK